MTYACSSKSVLRDLLKILRHGTATVEQVHGEKADLSPDCDISPWTRDQ